MSQRLIAVLFSTLLTPLIAHTVSADTFDINLSDSSAQFKYLTTIAGAKEGRTELGFGFLYNDDDNYMGELSFIITDVPGTKAPGLELGVGPKLFVIKHDQTNLDAVSIALGVQARYKIPRVTRINFYGSAFYAPGIVSFADARSAREFTAGVGYEILPTANVYIGYRFVGADLDPYGKKTIDETGLVGLSFSF